MQVTADTTREELGRLLWSTNPKLAKTFFPELKPVRAIGMTGISKVLQRACAKPYPSFMIDGIEHAFIRPVIEDTLCFTGIQVWTRARNYCRAKGSYRTTVNMKVQTDEGLIGIKHGWKEGQYAPLDDILAGVALTPQGRKRIATITELAA